MTFLLPTIGVKVGTDPNQWPASSLLHPPPDSWTRSLYHALWCQTHRHTDRSTMHHNTVQTKSNPTITAHSDWQVHRPKWSQSIQTIKQFNTYVSFGVSALVPFDNITKIYILIWSGNKSTGQSQQISQPKVIYTSMQTLSCPLSAYAASWRSLSLRQGWQSKTAGRICKPWQVAEELQASPVKPAAHPSLSSATFGQRCRAQKLIYWQIAVKH